MVSKHSISARIDDVHTTVDVITSAHVIKPLLSNDSTPTHPLLSPGYNVEVRIDTYREVCCY